MCRDELSAAFIQLMWSLKCETDGWWETKNFLHLPAAVLWFVSVTWKEIDKKNYSNNVWKHVIMIQRKFACSKPTKETGLWNRLKVNNKSTATTTMAPFSSISIVDLEQVNVSWGNMFNVKTSSRGVKISVKYLWWRFYQIYPPKRNFLSKTEKTNINI